jgi:hypothetical protein
MHTRSMAAMPLSLKDGKHFLSAADTSVPPEIVSLVVALLRGADEWVTVPQMTNFHVPNYQRYSGKSVMQDRLCRKVGDNLSVHDGAENFVSRCNTIVDF